MWATQGAKDKAPYEAKAARLKEKYEKVPLCFWVVLDGVACLWGGVPNVSPLLLFQDVAAYRAKGGSGKSDAGKKSGPGRPAAKKAVPADDDDDDDEDEEEEDEDDDDEDDD